tara:strand:+ start:212 stop:421 length:210 start_codon:yes stop_codon:yes gene_type:complete
MDKDRLFIARVSWQHVTEFNQVEARRTSFFCSTWAEGFRTAKDYVTENKLGAEEHVKIELREALTDAIK